MLSKIGATQWTVGKLMTIVLLIVVLVLVVYGVSVKGLNPLIERAGGMLDNVGFGGNNSNIEKECVIYSEDIVGVGSGVVTNCRGSCSVELENGLSLGKEFNWTDDYLFVRKNSQWDKIWDEIDNVPLAVRERAVNKILTGEFEGYVSSGDYGYFMSSRIVPVYILVKGDAGRKKYFKWEGGVWFEEGKDNEWEKGKWKNDFEGLKEIYSESDDPVLDDDVFFRIGNSDTVRMYHLMEDGGDFVSFEDIGASDDSYELFDIFSGDSGKIGDDADFEIFQEWFSSEKNKIIEYQGVLDEGMRNFEELLLSESSGEFDGEPYYLFLERDSDGEGVFYLEISVDNYGLKGEELKLVKDSGDVGWKVAESSSTLFLEDEEFEERVSLHQIRKFLELLC